MEGSETCRLLCFDSEISLMLDINFMDDSEGVKERCYKIPRANYIILDFLTWTAVLKSAYLWS